MGIFCNTCEPTIRFPCISKGRRRASGEHGRRHSRRRPGQLNDFSHFEVVKTRLANVRDIPASTIVCGADVSLRANRMASAFPGVAAFSMSANEYKSVSSPPEAR